MNLTMIYQNVSNGYLSIEGIALEVRERDNWRNDFRLLCENRDRSNQ